MNAITAENRYIQALVDGTLADISDFFWPFSYHNFAAVASELCPTDSNKLPGAVPAAFIKKTQKQKSVLGGSKGGFKF